MLQDQNEPIPLRQRFFSLPTLLSFGIGISLIFFLATRFEIDWRAMLSNVRGMNPWMYALGLALYYASFLFRGLRWRLLAQNTGSLSSPGTRIPSVLQCARFIIMGWFVNSIMWLRLGDAYRAYIFAEESRGRFSWSLGTVLAERVIDTATVFAILIISGIILATTATQDSPASSYVLLGASVLAALLLFVIVVMKFFGARIARLLPDRIESAYGQFHQGTLGSFKQIPFVFGLGLVGWGLEIARLYFVIQALGLDIPLALVPIVALGHALLSTVPTPGGVGAVEPGITGLLLLALERQDAASVALVDRSITYGSVILIGGLIFLARRFAGPGKASKSAKGGGPTEQGALAG